MMWSGENFFFLFLLSLWFVLDYEMKKKIIYLFYLGHMIWCGKRNLCKPQNIIIQPLIKIGTTYWRSVYVIF